MVVPSDCSMRSTTLISGRSFAAAIWTVWYLSFISFTTNFNSSSRASPSRSKIATRSTPNALSSGIGSFNTFGNRSCWSSEEIKGQYSTYESINLLRTSTPDAGLPLDAKPRIGSFTLILSIFRGVILSGESHPTAAIKQAVKTRVCTK